MCRRNRNILILIISMILIIGALLCVLFGKTKFTNKVEKELHGVRISKDTLGFKENITVFINGTIHRDNVGFTFKGELFLSNLEYSKGKNGFLIYSKSYDKNSIENGMISYVRNIIVSGKTVPDYATIHYVNTDSDLSYLVLTNYDEDCINNPLEDSIKVFNENDILVFPATDQESALTLIKERKIDKEIFESKSMENISGTH